MLITLYGLVSKGIYSQFHITCILITAWAYGRLPFMPVIFTDVISFESRLTHYIKLHYGKMKLKFKRHARVPRIIYFTRTQRQQH